MYNSTTKYVFVIIWLQFLPKFSKNQSTRNNSNENRTKPRRDDDMTMAGTYNNWEVTKLHTWSARGDIVVYSNQQICEINRVPIDCFAPPLSTRGDNQN